MDPFVQNFVLNSSCELDLFLVLGLHLSGFVLNLVYLVIKYGDGCLSLLLPLDHSCFHVALLLPFLFNKSVELFDLALVVLVLRVCLLQNHVFFLRVWFKEAIFLFADGSCQIFNLFQA